jgi:hypothetical protein
MRSTSQNSVIFDKTQDLELITAFYKPCTLCPEPCAFLSYKLGRDRIQIF